jgi:CheY-like chemotaxis protein
MYWRMPVMDGVEATRQICRLNAGDKVKIIAVTASVFKEQQAELLAAGTDDYVSKPFRINEIYERMARQLCLEYVYHPLAAAAVSVPGALTAQRLRGLTKELRDELHSALISLDSETISDVIDRICDVDSELGEMLPQLAGKFNYPTMLDALDRSAME